MDMHWMATVLSPVRKFSFSPKSMGLRSLMVCEEISPAHTHCLGDDHHPPKSGTQTSNMFPPFPIYIIKACGLGTEATSHLPFPADLWLSLLQEILHWWLQTCQVSWCWFCRQVFSQCPVVVFFFFLRHLPTWGWYYIKSEATIWPHQQHVIMQRIISSL